VSPARAPGFEGPKKGTHRNDDFSASRPRSDRWAIMLVPKSPRLQPGTPGASQNDWAGFRTWFWSNRYDAKVQEELATDAECLLLTRGRVTTAQRAMLLERALERALRESAILALASPPALGLVFALCWSSFAGWCAAGVVFGIEALRVGVTGLALRNARRVRTAMASGNSSSDRSCTSDSTFLN
jgi:hypothetical protein